MIKESVKHKYFLWQILLIVIPFLVLTVVFSLYSGNLIKESYIASEDSSLESLKMNTVDIYVSRIETILVNMDIKSLVSELEDKDELFETWSVIGRVLPEIEEIYFIHSDGRMVSPSSNKASPQNYSWYRDSVRPDTGFINWSEPYIDPGSLKYITTAFRPVYVNKDFIGLLCIDLQIATFFEKIKTAVIEHSGKLLVINNQGVIMNLYRNRNEPVEFGSLIDSSDFENFEGFKELEIAGVHYYTFSRSIPALHLKLLSLYEASLLSAEASMIYVFIFIVLFIVFIISGTIYVSIFNRVSWEIVRLADYTDAIAHGDLTIRTVTKEKDEFLTLNNHLNSMVKTMLQQIDDLKTLGDEKDALLQMRTNLIHILSHNATTPITVLFNTTGDLFEQNPGNREFYSLYSCAASLKTLIDNSMTYVKIEGSTPVIKADSIVNVNDQLEILGSVYEPLLHEKELQLRINCTDQVELNTSSFYFKVVLENIFDNAIKYSFKGSTIEITIEKTSDKGIIIIRDGGPGFKVSDKEKLFTRFGCLSAKPTGSEISTGLGLYLADSITRALKGRIQILEESFKDDYGAAIELIFPLKGF